MQPMIPVTSFAGHEVAVFGLGASGRSTCLALLAGGARVAAWDDGEAARTAAAAEGIHVVDLASADWSRFAVLVLAPGVPLTHPEPHWTVECAQEVGIEIIGEHSPSAGIGRGVRLRETMAGASSGADASLLYDKQAPQPAPAPVPAPGGNPRHE